MAFWNRGTEPLTQAAAPVAGFPAPTEQPPAPGKPEPEEKPAKFGRKVGRLTQIGNHWFDFSEVVHMDLNPEDACSCEVHLRGIQEPIHFHEDADEKALYAYMEMQAGLIPID